MTDQPYLVLFDADRIKDFVFATGRLKEIRGGSQIVRDATDADALVRRFRLSPDQVVFAGETSVGQIKRTFQALVEFLFRSQHFPHGAVLLTGTGVVPPETFTLQPEDVIRIDVSGIGTIENRVELV